MEVWGGGMWCLVVLLLRLLGFVGRLVRIHDKQRHDDRVHREQHKVLQCHFDIVAGHAVQRPGAGHQESGEDDREGQWADALGANDFGLNGTMAKYIRQGSTTYDGERIIVESYQAEERHGGQTEHQTEQDQAQSAGEHRFAFVLGVRNDGAGNGSANADTAPDGVLLLVRCVPIENGKEQNAEGQTHEVGANHGIVGERNTEAQGNHGPICEWLVCGFFS